MALKINYIKSSLEDETLRNELAKVVADVDVLIPQSKEEFMELQKFGLYPAEECVSGLTNFSAADSEPDPICLQEKVWQLIKLDFVNL